MLKLRFLRRIFMILLSTAALTSVSCNTEEDQRFEVIGVEVSVDQANFTGTCPHDFKFTGLIATNDAGAVTYFWERSGGNSDPVTTTVPGPGGLLVQDTVRLTLSGTFQVRLHVTAPNNVISNTVTASATCQ